MTGKKSACCIPFISYIKPQHLFIYCLKMFCCIPFISYIKPQLRYAVRERSLGCIPFISYIKPQRPKFSAHATAGLYIILFLHQATTEAQRSKLLERCISFFSYIKPQLLGMCFCMSFRCISFFSYIKPQPLSDSRKIPFVVYHSFPTSSHNVNMQTAATSKLYIILFLHPATTTLLPTLTYTGLYIILFLHQATTVALFWCVC